MATISNQFCLDNPSNLIITLAKINRSFNINIQNIGQMFMFFYDPKNKQTLPYYDRFPLVFPIELYSDGFLGINLHYLPQKYRANLMDALYSIELLNKAVPSTTRVSLTTAEFTLT